MKVQRTDARSGIQRGAFLLSARAGIDRVADTGSRRNLAIRFSGKRTRTYCSLRFPLPLGWAHPLRTVARSLCELVRTDTASRSNRRSISSVWVAHAISTFIDSGKTWDRSPWSQPSPRNIAAGYPILDTGLSLIKRHLPAVW